MCDKPNLTHYILNLQYDIKIPCPAIKITYLDINNSSPNYIHVLPYSDKKMKYSDILLPYSYICNVHADRKMNPDIVMLFPHIKMSYYDNTLSYLEFIVHIVTV